MNLLRFYFAIVCVVLLAGFGVSCSRSDSSISSLSNVVTEVHGSLINPPLETNAAVVVAVAPSVELSNALVALPTGMVPRPAKTILPPRPNYKHKIEPEVLHYTSDGYLQVGFDKLASFQVLVIYQLLDPVKFTRVPKLDRPIPPAIKSLDGQNVALTGFMLPLKLQGNQVTEFFLMRSQSMCCYGKPLLANELAYVRMKANAVPSMMDQLITVSGKLHVGEVIQDGRLAGLYQLDADKMSAQPIPQ